MRLRWVQAKDRQVRVDTHDKYTQISHVDAPNLMESLKLIKKGATSPMSSGKNENVTNSLLLNDYRAHNSTNIKIKDLSKLDYSSDDAEVSEKGGTYKSK